jgi:hypothetical protein
VLEVDVPGRLPVRSIADANGAVAVLFGYPTPPVEPLGSSPVSPLSAPQSVRLVDQIWTLAVRLAYGRLAVAPESLPDVDEVLAQPAATMWQDLAQTRELRVAALQFGQETVLRSVDDSGLTRPSVVYVQGVTPR